MTTYYVEATITMPGHPMDGQLMADSGLSAEQVEQMRAAERAGRITGLTISEDIDLVAAFSNPF